MPLSQKHAKATQVHEQKAVPKSSNTYNPCEPDVENDTQNALETWYKDTHQCSHFPNLTLKEKRDITRIFTRLSIHFIIFSVPWTGWCCWLLPSHTAERKTAIHQILSIFHLPFPQFQKLFQHHLENLYSFVSSMFLFLMRIKVSS
jgi:hypothetical protein